jgi:hypothetical protein
MQLNPILMQEPTGDICVPLLVPIPPSQTTSELFSEKFNNFIKHLKQGPDEVTRLFTIGGKSLINMDQIISRLLFMEFLKGIDTREQENIFNTPIEEGIDIGTLFSTLHIFVDGAKKQLASKSLDTRSADFVKKWLVEREKDSNDTKTHAWLLKFCRYIGLFAVLIKPAEESDNNKVNA